MGALCNCHCHWDRTKPLSVFRGVDVTDVIEAVSACASCQWSHDIPPAQTSWSNDATGDDDGN